MGKYCDGEKIDFEVLTDLYGISTPEYGNAVSGLPFVCVCVCVCVRACVRAWARPH
jgi:hypothetical protein